MCGIPMAMSEVRQEDVALCINEIHDELLACHADIPDGDAAAAAIDTTGRPRLEAISAGHHRERRESGRAGRGGCLHDGH